MNYERMEYRNLGPTGLKVSILSFGNMTSGMSQNSLFGPRDFGEEEKNVEFLDRIIRGGINFIDTA